ncbi:MAG: hypothetical protein AAF612_08415 [Planctomycetota bacterium]
MTLRGVTASLVGAAWLLCFCGCVVTEERVIRGGWLDLPGAIKGGGAGVVGADGRTRQEVGWTIEVARWTGQNGRSRAWTGARVLRESGLPGQVWYREAGALVTLYFGRFASAEDPEASSMLSMVQGLTYEGGMPFASARLAPIDPQSRAAPTDDPLDARRFAGSYTLAVGFYDPSFGEGYRDAAEQAARVLRDQGEEAYFYHASRNSLVTIGEFTDDDFVMHRGARAYGPRVRAVQQRFPDFAGNGRVLERVRQGQVIGRRKTFLVRVR